MLHNDILYIYDYIKFILTVSFTYVLMVVITTMYLKRFMMTIFNIIFYFARDVLVVVIKNVMPYVIMNYV